MRNNSSYLNQIYIALPRLLALFDTDPYSSTCGVGDRFYWGWKLIDFGNGTFQGAANGLARLLANDLLPPWIERKSIEERISQIFYGSAKLVRKNGSMEEAFPYESSFCITALVAYDLLTSMELQRDTLSKDDWANRLNIVKPMIHYLYSADEYHAFISNHLATAVSALYKWFSLTNDTVARDRSIYFLKRILSNMSGEGWFNEYDGADPGYQTLCMYYLADFYRMNPLPEVKAALGKACKFIWHFAHPDGSFGGLYGSRNTRFFYPAAFELLKGDFPEASVLAEFMKSAISAMKTVTLASMDDHNLIPMFNCYAWTAALEVSADAEKKNTDLKIPALCSGEQNYDFSGAGICIRGTDKHYTIISIKKGGVTASFSRDGKRSNIDAGNVICYQGRLYSTQVNNCEESTFAETKNGLFSVEVEPNLMLRSLPKPWQFAILRILNCTFMRNQWFNEMIKKILVSMLITGNKGIKYKVVRNIDLQGNLASVEARWKDQELTGRLPPIEKSSKPFKSIHMASSGYWQRGDDE